MKSLIAVVVDVLREGGPLEVFNLAAAARGRRQVKGRPLVLSGGRKPRPVEVSDLACVREILESVKRDEHGLRIVEYPTFRLGGSTPKPLPSGRYLRCALQALAESHRPLSLAELAARYSQKYGSAAIVPEFWMLTALQSERKGLVAQAGQLRVGLRPDHRGIEVADRRPRSASVAESEKPELIHAKMYEENLESLIVERLEEVEPGLTLIQRQYVTTVGRIDLLCKDRRGNFVVVELKRFRASTESITDQVTRYIGWVQEHLAKRRGTVRACIVVGKIDKKLEYSVRAIPNLRVKCLRVSLSDPD